MSTVAQKFVSWEVPELKTLAGSNVYQLREKLNTGEQLSREEKNWITENVNKNSCFKYAIPLMGYCFDFSDVLKTFVVKQHGYYHEYSAVDRTGLRSILCGRIDKIIEL
jgi:hypothetical protein